MRHSFDVDVSDRDLYETYLPAFKACIVEVGASSADIRLNGSILVR